MRQRAPATGREASDVEGQVGFRSRRSDQRRTMGDVVRSSFKTGLEGLTGSRVQRMLEEISFDTLSH